MHAEQQRQESRFAAYRETCPMCLGGRQAPALGWCATCEGAGEVYTLVVPAAGARAEQASEQQDEDAGPFGTGEIPRSPVACLRTIARLADELQARQFAMSALEAARSVCTIAACAQRALEFFNPKEEPSGAETQDVAEATAGARYHVYRLLVDGVPVYVGQSSDVAARFRSHMSEATASPAYRTRKVLALRAALAQEKTVTYEVVASAATEREILDLERHWVMRTLAEGHEITNGASLYR